MLQAPGKTGHTGVIICIKGLMACPEVIIGSALSNYISFQLTDEYKMCSVGAAPGPGLRETAKILKSLRRRCSMTVLLSSFIF